MSLGIENFDDRILKENGRAHLAKEVYKAWDWIEKANFDSVNIDLIAGMVGETEDNWTHCIEKTLALSPDSVTIYQMELPFNTVYSKDVVDVGSNVGVADWPQKRKWVAEAFSALESVGYAVSSGYTLVRDPEEVLRDPLVIAEDLHRVAEMLHSIAHRLSTSTRQQQPTRPTAPFFY